MPKCLLLLPGKDLAVSPLVFARVRQAHNKLYARRLAPFGARRLCSHLYHHWPRALPATLLDFLNRRMEVRTFLSPDI